MGKNSRSLKIDYGRDAFFADSVGLFHGASKFVFDFKQTTPRIDQIDDKQHEAVVVKHAAIMTDPITAKMFLKILTENVSNYEKKHGEIELPESVKQTQQTEKKGNFNYIG